MKGQPQPLTGYRGTRYDPPWAWLFGKGYHGPEDTRPWPHNPAYTMDQAQAWGLRPGIGK